MSYGRAYTAGEYVKVDQGVIVASPTLGPCTVPAEVVLDSNEAEVQVYLSIEGASTMYVYKDRVAP